MFHQLHKPAEVVSHLVLAPPIILTGIRLTGRCINKNSVD